MYKISIIIGMLCFLINGCSGCASNPENNEYIESSIEEVSADRYGKNIVKMRKTDGSVFEIPIEVNGVKMYFIFDTGAGIISISETEAKFLIKQGTLDLNDVIGISKFQDATGAISEGMVVNLRSIKIGNKTLKNVEASIVSNEDAPLLLGQSALSRFGKFTVDYSNGTISFER